MLWGYTWGIWWWRITGKGMDATHLKTNLVAIPTTITTAEDLRQSDVLKLRKRGLDCGIPLHVPTDIVVAGNRINVHNKQIIVHQWNGFVSIGSICTAGGSNYVASPEFCLLQVASSLKRNGFPDLRTWQYTVILAELVCELCGTYSKQNTARGFKGHDKPLTTIGTLMVYCGRMAFEPGANNLRLALAWSLDGLNSPMETALFLLLCLPRSYGGLELPRPISNPIIPVPQELWGKTHLRNIIPDLFWPEANLIVEYNGADAHEGTEVDDQERQEIAQDMGYFVITFRKTDLYNRKRFVEKARSVAKYLGHALPASTTQFDQAQRLLHDMLLRHERWV